MRRLGWVALVALATATGSVQAQTPQWAVGTWKGKLENYNGTEGPDRIMTVSADGKCTWNSKETSRPASVGACKITADSIAFTTTGKAQVSLQNKGGRLQGTWQSASGGKSYHISLTKQ
jgi:hypothetical protein